MTASGTTADVVSSLKSLRNDYQSKLQDSPQYAAFLALEHAWTSAAEALGIDLPLHEAPPHPSVAASTGAGETSDLDTSSNETSLARDVVGALTTAYSKYRQHLESVPQYRALLAINKLIDELSASVLEELAIETAPLSGLHRDTDYEEKVEMALEEDTPTSYELGHVSSEEAAPLPASDVIVSAVETAPQDFHVEVASSTAEALAPVEFSDTPFPPVIEPSEAQSTHPAHQAYPIVETDAAATSDSTEHAA